MKKALLIFNILSGKGAIRQKIGEIIDLLIKNGYEVMAHATQSKGDATRLSAERAGEFDLVVCCGGDGTLNETISGMLESGLRIPIGYIPAGSTNDFASSLNLPRGIMKAAEVAVTGTPFSCDIGSFNGKSFVYAAAFGMFSDISYRTKQEWKNVIGHAAYLVESSKEFGGLSVGMYPSIELSVSVNGEELEDTFVYGMITNSISIGGIRDITGKDVKLDDGLLEVTLVRRPKNQFLFAEIIATLTNLQKDSQYIYTCKAREIVLRAKEPVSRTLDGEFGGECTETKIQCLEHAVDINRICSSKSSNSS